MYVSESLSLRDPRCVELILRKRDSPLGFGNAVPQEVAICCSEKLDTADIGLLRCRPSGVERS